MCLVPWSILELNYGRYVPLLSELFLQGSRCLGFSWSQHWRQIFIYLLKSCTYWHTWMTKKTMGNYECLLTCSLEVFITEFFSLYVQVKAGSIFDNILITDDPDYAKSFAEETWGKNKEVGSLTCFSWMVHSQTFLLEDWWCNCLGLVFTLRWNYFEVWWCGSFGMLRLRRKCLKRRIRKQQNSRYEAF